VEAMYCASDVGAQIRSLVADLLRSLSAELSLDELFCSRGSLGDSVKRKVTPELLNFGFEVRNILITGIAPEPEVVQAVNALKVATLKWDAAKIEAEAQAIRVVKNAEAESLASKLKGEGSARRWEQLILGVRDSITEGGDAQKLSPDLLSHLFLISEWFESLQDIAGQSKDSLVYLPVNLKDPRQTHEDVKAAAVPLKMAMSPRPGGAATSFTTSIMSRVRG